jgi:hypothetical protein
MGTIIRYREICIHVDNIPLHVHDSGKWDIPADAWILVGCVLQFYFPNISLLDPLEGLILIVVTMPNKLMFPAPRRSWTRHVFNKNYGFKQLVDMLMEPVNFECKSKQTFF